MTLNKHAFTGSTRNNILRVIDKDKIILETIQKVDQYNYLFSASNVVLQRSKVLDENNIQSFAITENAFPINIDDVSYYHLLVEGIGQYLFIKNFIPDLKLIIIKENGVDFDNLNGSYKKFIIDLLNKKDVFVFDHGFIDKIIFKKIFYTDLNHNLLLRFDSCNFIFSDWKEIKDVPTLILNYLKEIKKCVQIPNSDYKKSKKIFLDLGSRPLKFFNDFFKNFNTVEDFKKDNDKYQNLLKLINLNNRSDEEIDMYINQKFDEWQLRYIEEDDENKIIEYFKNNGYEIVYPEKMNFDEEIIMFNNASHIATFTGSNSISSIFCNDNTKFILLNMNTNYIFPHSNIVKHFVKNHIILFDHEDVGKKIFTSQKIIDELEKNKYYLN